METPEILQPTPLGEIKKTLVEKNIEGTPVQLPSGVVVKLRKPSVYKLISENKIPSELVSTIMKGEKSKEASTPKEFEDNVKALDELILHAFVYPKMVRKAVNELAEDEITMDFLSDDDKNVVIAFIQGDVSNLRPFRDESNVDSSGQGVQKVSKSKAKPISGN